jgi:hypothetical protein
MFNVCVVLCGASFLLVRKMDHFRLAVFRGRNSSVETEVFARDVLSLPGYHNPLVGGRALVRRLILFSGDLHLYVCRISLRQCEDRAVDRATGEGPKSGKSHVNE